MLSPPQWQYCNCHLIEAWCNASFRVKSSRAACLEVKLWLFLSFWTATRLKRKEGVCSTHAHLEQRVFFMWLVAGLKEPSKTKSWRINPSVFVRPASGSWERSNDHSPCGDGDMGAVSIILDHGFTETLQEKQMQSLSVSLLVLSSRFSQNLYDNKSQSLHVLWIVRIWTPHPDAAFIWLKHVQSRFSFSF